MKKPPRRQALPEAEVDAKLKAAMRAVESQPVPEALTKLVDALPGSPPTRRDRRN